MEITREYLNFHLSVYKVIWLSWTQNLKIVLLNLFLYRSHWSVQTRQIPLKAPKDGQASFMPTSFFFATTTVGALYLELSKNYFVVLVLMYSPPLLNNG